ncbi:hypothetical protein CAEBREN_21628 [Caenorhabditis brenneri]|uniref:Uncharacterized protein n=1 Tax=Caenorhabditis brenneri TaxID=135651 RepID=G0P368_CAEBE|nr:hypothetical protein CAEBREN_21628 [Caenorhabditis brenneri]
MTDVENPIATTGNKESPVKKADAVEEKAIDQDLFLIKNIPTFIGFKQFEKLLEIAPASSVKSSSARLPT